VLCRMGGVGTYIAFRLSVSLLVQYVGRQTLSCDRRYSSPLPFIEIETPSSYVAVKAITTINKQCYLGKNASGTCSYHWVLNINALFSLLHRACCRVTQLLYQLLHIYKIYKMYTLKHLNIKNAPTCFGPRTIVREPYAATIPNWYSEINVTFYSDFIEDDMAP